jgi:CRP/FNR family transcriptional regulator, cyclic AMP receptor protein
MDFVWENLFRKNRKELTLTQKLKENILFQDLSSSELKLIENIVNLRSYRPGETVFRQGEIGVGMYIIKNGAVNIYVEELNSTSGEIKNSLVTTLKEDDFFGDLALVEENGRRSATAVASVETNLIGFFKPALLEITARNPSAGVKILMKLGEVLGTRLKETTQRITEMKRSNSKVAEL